MKKNITLVFPEFGTLHIYKDVGMVPIWFNNTGKYSVKIATEKKEGLDKHQMLNNISIDLIPSYFLKKSINAAIYIFKNYRSIDILHLYHYTPSTFILCFLYFILCICSGKKYVTYIKLDISEDLMNKITNPLYLPLTKIVTKLLTHVSVEFAVDYERLKSLGVFPKVYHISNSFALPDGYEKLSKAVKENIILHITRAGSYQKNTEELLAIVPELLKQYPDWSLYIVGPYTDEIKGSITNIKNNYLYLDKQFRLLGNINSREELEKLYAKSKVLIMTSRWEGYPLALVESRRWGLKVISSKIKRLEEILIGHSNYFTYKSGNIEELLSVVSDALRDDYYFTSGRYNLERSEYSRLNSWSCKIEKIAYDLYNI